MFIINVRTTHVIRKHGEFKRVVNITQTPKMVEFFPSKVEQRVSHVMNQATVFGVSLAVS